MPHAPLNLNAPTGDEVKTTTCTMVRVPVWASRRACAMPFGIARDGERPGRDARAGTTHQGRFRAMTRPHLRTRACRTPN